MRTGKEWTDMLEVKYKEEKNPSEKSTDEAPEKNAEEFELPKNVKQVGEVEKERKLYIEDYVITYLQQLTKIRKERRRQSFWEKKRYRKIAIIFLSAEYWRSRTENLAKNRKKRWKKNRKSIFLN